ncbi:hypothetical protein HDE_05911 [Halotydeus destructor]|nr:hypothetical protein HDE_05911 [Halotydeus destructor]
MKPVVEKVSAIHAELNVWFRCALLTNGVILSDRQVLPRYVRYLSTGLSFANLISNVYRIVLNVILICAGYSIYRDIMFITMAALSIIGQYQVMANRKKISRTIMHVLRVVKAQDRARLHNLGRNYGFLMLTGTAVEVVRRCCLWYMEGTALYLKRTNLKLSHSNFYLDSFCAFDIISFSHFTFGWIIQTMVIYGFIFKLIEAYDDQFYESSCLQVVENLASDDKRMLAMISKIRHRHHELIMRKKSLMESLNLLPLLWYASLFMETTTRLVHFTSSFKTITLEFIMVKWSSYAISLLFAIWVTVQVEDIVSTESRRAYTLSNTLNKIDCNSWDIQAEIFGLTLEIGNNHGQRPSACGFFDLKKSIILSFMGAAIPFSVMINEFVAAARGRN